MYDVRLDSGDTMHNVSADHVRRRFILESNGNDAAEMTLPATPRTSLPRSASYALTQVSPRIPAETPSTADTQISASTQLPAQELQQFGSTVTVSPMNSPVQPMLTPNETVSGQVVSDANADSQEIPDVDGRLTAEPEGREVQSSHKAPPSPREKDSREDHDDAPTCYGDTTPPARIQEPGQIDISSGQPGPPPGGNAPDPHPVSQVSRESQMTPPTPGTSQAVSDEDTAAPFYGFPAESTLSHKDPDPVQIPRRSYSPKFGRGRGRGTNRDCDFPGLPGVRTQKGRISKPSERLVFKTRVLHSVVIHNVDNSCLKVF